MTTLFQNIYEVRLIWLHNNHIHYNVYNFKELLFGTSHIYHNEIFYSKLLDHLDKVYIYHNNIQQKQPNILHIFKKVIELKNTFNILHLQLFRTAFFMFYTNLPSVPYKDHHDKAYTNRRFYNMELQLDLYYYKNTFSLIVRTTYFWLFFLLFRLFRLLNIH